MANRTYADVRDGIVRAVINATRPQLTDVFGSNSTRMIVVPSDVAKDIATGWTWDGEMFSPPPERPYVQPDPSTMSSGGDQ